MRPCITIAPGGFLGFYMLGVASFVKQTYDVSGHRIGGCSAGSVVAAYALSPLSDAAVLRRCVVPFVEAIRDERVAFRWPRVTPRPRRGCGGSLALFAALN